MVDKRPRVCAPDFKMAEKSLCVDLRNGEKNYSVQVFKTMQGIQAWIGPFDIVFAAYCCGIFVPASVVFYITCLLLSDRGFKVS